MPVFSVVIVTASPPGVSGDAGAALVKIDGREALLRSVELFLNRDNIKQIQLVFTTDMLEEGKRKYGSHLSFSGVKVLSGGPKWIDQLAAAGEKLSPDATHVVVHDAARPAVPFSDIDDLLTAAEKHPVVALAAPVRAALAELDEGGGAMAFHAANRFVQLLAPQCFKRDKFLEMCKTKSEPHASQFTLLKASPLNLRLGGGVDASLVKAMINMLPKPKIKAPLSPFEEAQW